MGCFIIKKIGMYNTSMKFSCWRRVTDINSMNICPDVLLSCIFITASNEGERKLPVLMTEPKPGVLSLYFVGVSSSNFKC